jgi:hypothetical protein
LLGAVVLGLALTPVVGAVLRGGITAAPESAGASGSQAADGASRVEAGRAYAALAGTWRDEGQGFAEETWSGERDGRMVGMFRWHKPDGTVMVYELMTIDPAPTGDSDARAVLRLRHFDAALTPWASEAEGPLRFRLERAEGGVLEWVSVDGLGRVERMTHEVVGAELITTVRFPPESSRAPLVLRKTRLD